MVTNVDPNVVDWKPSVLALDPLNVLIAWAPAVENAAKLEAVGADRYDRILEFNWTDVESTIDDVRALVVELNSVVFPKIVEFREDVRNTDCVE